MAKMQKSFQQWCIENNKQHYLDMWDYNLNSDTPDQISQSSDKKRWFKCNNENHQSFQRIIQGLRISKDQICPYCNSFYDWCINNNHQDYIDAWDYERNTDNIKTISWSSGKKQWFNVGNYSYQYDTAHITGDTPNCDPISRYYHSFGYWLISTYGDDAINKYWSDKNTTSPYDYAKGSTIKVYFKCNQKDYHDDYLMSMECFVRGYRCPFCASKQIHKYDSFGYYWDQKIQGWYEKCWAEDNTDDPYSISIKASTLVHIRCPAIPYHDFWITPLDYSQTSENNNYCPFCSGHRIHVNDSLGTKYPNVLDIWSDKNEKSPYEYSVYSNQDVWWKCNDGIHDDYKRRPNLARRSNYYCPKCSESLTISSYECAVYQYLTDLGYKPLTEYDCNIAPINPLTGLELPYDNEVEELRLIIEVHGEQHYTTKYYTFKNLKSTPEEALSYQQWKDNYKKEYALNNDYNFLTIPYWTIKDESYKSIIDDKIKCIKNHSSVSTTGITW